jgi:hypothetical protein
VLDILLLVAATGVAVFVALLMFSGLREAVLDGSRGVSSGLRGVT